MIICCFPVCFREWCHSSGSSSLLFTAQGEGGHQTYQPREVPDQYGRTPGKTHTTLPSKCKLDWKSNWYWIAFFFVCYSQSNLTYSSYRSIIDRADVTEPDSSYTTHKSHRPFPAKVSFLSNLETGTHVLSCTVACWTSNQANIQWGKVHCLRQFASLIAN